MTHNRARPHSGARAATSGSDGRPVLADQRATRLLAAGALAGPLFVASSVLQALTREGFSFADNPPSALSGGGLGWVQVITFVAAGLLLVCGGIGLRGQFRGPGAVWAPRLVTGFGAALIAGGVFPMDPAFGFPPGTPNGMPDDVTWHGALHGVVFPVGFAALLAATLVFARHYQHEGRPRWVWPCRIAGPLVLVLAAWPNTGEPQGRFIPLWLGVGIAFGWLGAVLADQWAITSRVARD